MLANDFSKETTPYKTRTFTLAWPCGPAVCRLWLLFSSCSVCLFPQELNVRAVTLSADKGRYGVRLRAEPEHTVLGRRLKGAFKPVMAAIKELSSEQLERFQETGL